MRRLLALALVVAAAGLVTGCSGVDAQKAQGILDQSTGSGSAYWRCLVPTLRRAYLTG